MVLDQRLEGGQRRKWFLLLSSQAAVFLSVGVFQDGVRQEQTQKQKEPWEARQEGFRQEGGGRETPSRDLEGGR